VKLSGTALCVGQWLHSHVAIIFLLWSVWLAFEYFGFGPASYVRIHDNGDSILPARLAWATLSDGQLGYWDPLRASGVDWVAARGVNGIINLPFVMLPGWLAYGLMMWLQRFVAGYFTFRLLKESLKLDTLPALYAGLAYSFFAQDTINGSWAGFTLYNDLTLPGLPFFLWAMIQMNGGNTFRSYIYVAGLGVLFSAISFNGFALFLIPVFVFYLTFVTDKSTKRSWVILTIFIVAWLLSELPTLWSSFLNAPLSHRADWISNSPLSAQKNTLGWLGKLSFVRGLVWDNALSLGLASVGLIVSRGRDRRLVFLSCAVIFCLGFILSYPFLKMIVDPYLGFLSGFQFDRVYLVVPFLVIVCGAIGVHLVSLDWRLVLTRTMAYRYGLSVRTLLVMSAIGLIAWQSLNVKDRTLSEMSRGSNFATLYRHPDLKQLAENKKTLSPFRVATISIPWGRHVQHPAYAWAYALESADGYVGLYPQRYQDFWEQVIAPLIAKDQKRYNYFHYWGNRIYLFSPSSGFPNSDQMHFSDYYDVNLLSLANVRYVISPLPIRDKVLTLLPSHLRDEQLTWRDRRFRYKLLGMLKGQYPGIPLYIYENPRVLPRFFLAGHAQRFDKSTQVLTALRQASYDDLRSTAYLEGGGRYRLAS